MESSSRNSVAPLLARARLLVFDLDGTLADSSGLHARAFSRVLGRLDVPVDYSAIAGMRTNDAVRLLLERAGIDSPSELVESLAAEKQAIVRNLMSDELVAIAGVDEFIRWARPRYGLALCSSGSRASVGLALATLGYLDTFSPIICSEDVLRAKPDPEGYLKLLKMTGCEPEQALVFEDSASGVSSALAAGVPVLRVGDETDAVTWAMVNDAARSLNGMSARPGR